VVVLVIQAFSAMAPGVLVSGRRTTGLDAGNRMNRVTTKSRRRMPASTSRVESLERALRRRTADLAAAYHSLEASRADLEEARESLEHLLSASPAMVFRFDPETLQLTYASPNIGWLLGYSPSEALAFDGFWEHVIHPDDCPRLCGALRDATQNLVAVIEQECRYRASDGRYRWFLTLLRVDYDLAARPTRILGYALDLGERKAAEEELRRARALSDAIIENLPAMVIVKDARELRYARFNRAAEDTLGISRDAVIGKTDAELFPAAFAEAATLKDRMALQTRMAVDIPEDAITTRAGDRRVLHSKKIPLVDESGDPIHLLGVSIDITEQRAAHERLRLAQLATERASRAKSDFLSRMSHDMRTPLNAILGFAQILQMDRLTPDQAEGVQQILRGGVHLIDLINEVLDIARIEVGQLSLSPEPVPVEEVVSHVVSLVRPLGTPRQITVTTDKDASGLHVRADRQRLNQILVNLVSNAVKYNRDGGSVHVSWKRRGDFTRILVRDTGPGIPEIKKMLLFQPFERLGAEQSSVEGTGLGLAVSKGLTEAMGGRIGLDSALDAGSTFWIELPTTAAPAIQEPDPVSRATESPRHVRGSVLYVEDNRSNVRLLERLLARRPDVTLVTVPTGDAALQAVRTSPPDLILLDLHLPDMTGDEVLRRIWADPDTRRIPVAVLSADATLRQQQRLLSAGAVAYLTKPLDVPALLRVIDERLGHRPPP
jgi:PAS domain S-box-containing protein